MSGVYALEAPKGTNGRGGYVLIVAYTDKGTEKRDALTAEKIFALRKPTINPEKYDAAKGTQLLTTPGRSFNMVENDGYLGYHDLDLTGISEIIIGAEASPRVDAAGAIIEVRLDSPTGKLIGTTEKVVPVEIDIRAEVRKLRAAWEKGGKKGPEPNFWRVRNMFKPKFNVPLTEVTGMHHVYFVFKNEEVKEGQILVSMNEIEFKQATSVVQ